MENAVRALEIAAGVLLGVIIMAVVVYFFSTIGLWPQEQDDIESVEQLRKFNLEYEVYDKKGMYGADVISCLTKAQSNNEKYVKGGSFLSGNKYGEEFLINVYVKLNSNLKENIEIKRINDKNKEVQILSEYELRNDLPEDRIKKLKGYELGKDLNFKIPLTNGYTKFTPDTILGNILFKNEDFKLTGSGYIDTGNGPYGPDENHLNYNAQLYDVNNIENETPLQNLLKFASINMKQTVKNHSEDSEDLRLWSSATWKTGLYDFKTRKFKCDEIKYNDKTGRVNAICFSEI